MPTPNIEHKPKVRVRKEKDAKELGREKEVKKAARRDEMENAEKNSEQQQQQQSEAPQELAYHRPHSDILYDPYAFVHEPACTSFLRPNSSFIGSQQSRGSIYEVMVELKEVDLRRSFLTGFLTIHGLTKDYPEMTTFFRAEIVGPRYSFLTNHPNWGSTKHNDLQHWGRFASWRKAKFDTEDDTNNSAYYRDALNDEFLYMRWKEIFLVPDSHVKNIQGASFAGFYYICFNQYTGQISGLYFHESSDKFQLLDLTHIPDGGVSSSYQYA